MRDSVTNDMAVREPGTIATPQGDGEFAPDEPLAPDAVAAALAGLETPPGSAPAAYDSDGGTLPR